MTVPEQTCHGLSHRKLISKEICLKAPCKTPVPAGCEFRLPRVGDGGMLAVNSAATPTDSLSCGCSWLCSRWGCRRGHPSTDTQCRCWGSLDRLDMAFSWTELGRRSSSPSPNLQPREKETNVSNFAMSSAAAGHTWKRLIGKPFCSPMQRAVERHSSCTLFPSFITKWVTQKLSAQYCKSLSMQGSEVCDLIALCQCRYPTEK